MQAKCPPGCCGAPLKQGDPDVLTVSTRSYLESNQNQGRWGKVNRHGSTALGIAYLCAYKESTLFLILS